MRIVQLSAENYKRLQVVEIKPDGDVVTITGANASGKSSILDAIATALGGAEETPGMPVRRGEETARIRLDLGEVVVTKRFRPGRDPQLVVESADGARYPSPQRMLDELVGRIAFDPLAFARAKPKDQLDTLRGLVKIEVDLDRLDAQNARDYAARTETAREAKRLRAQADGIVVGDEPLPAPADLDALLAEMQAAGERNAALERERAARDGVRATAKENFARAEQINQRIGGLRGEIAKLEAEIAGLDTEAKRRIAENARLLSELSQMPLLGDPIDVGALRAEVQRVRAANEAIATEARRRESRALIVVERDEAETAVRALTEAIDARTAEKRRALADAVYPVPGLALGAEGALYNGVPLDQASQAEKIRISCAIAMSTNPKLRVLLVRDGSLLDEAGLAALAAACSGEGYQLWLERTDTSGRIGIIMEDGRIRGAAAPPAGEPARVEGFAE